MGKRKQKRQQTSNVERQKAYSGEADKAAVVKSEKKKTIFFLALILMLAVIVFSNSLSNGFTNWDDDRNVYENPYIRNITTQNLAVYFTKPLLSMYTPLIYLSYAMDYKIGQLNPSVYHTTNLLLHLINIVLVFFVIRRLTENIEMAAIVALFFGIHPMNVGAVAPVSVRSSLLYSMFYLAAYISYIVYIKDGFRKRYILLSFVFFVLSVLSKSAAVIFPLLLVLTDWYYQRKFNSKTLIEKIPFVIISVVSGILTIVFREDVEHIGSPYSFAMFERIFLVSYALVFYLAKLVLPFNLSAYYPYPEKASGMLPRMYYLAPFILAAVVFAIAKAQRYRRKLVFGGLFFMIHIALVLKVVPMGGEIVADRYVYLPYIGLLMIMGWWYSGLPPMNRKRLYVVVSCLICVLFFSVLSYQQTLIWKDSLTLYDSVLKKYPRLVLAYSNRGLAKRIIGDHNGALDDYTKAIQIDPAYAIGYYNRAYTYVIKQNYDAALRDYDKAIELNSYNPDMLFNRGLVRFLTGNKQGACEDWRKAFQLGDSQADETLRRHCVK